MDINAVKLKRLTDHFSDDGVCSPQAVADILKAKPDNTVWLREYVEAAARELGQPDLLVQFDTAVKTPAKVEAPAADTRPPGENEIQSEPEATAPKEPVKLPAQTAPSSPFAGEGVAGAGAPVGPTGAKSPEGPPAGIAPVAQEAPGLPQLPGAMPDYQFRFKGPDGISHNLRAVHQKGNVVILELVPEVKDEIITVTLNGQPAAINLTDLRKKPAGEEVTINGKPFMVATLLVIADAAKQ